MAPSALIATEAKIPLTLDDVGLIKGAVKSSQVHVTIDNHSPTGIVTETLRQHVERIDHNFCDAGDEDAFFVADLGEVYRQHLRWKLNLKRVKPFYAVKANPDDRVLHLLAQLGTGFDCASKVEIQQVLGIGVDPSRIIYAQPCKAISFIRYAAEQSVKQMTFDSTEELWKIKQHCPDAKLFLRIITDDSSSPVRLSMKFGASLDDTAELLQLAKELGLNIVGLSFHVGSGGTNPSSFVKALQDARFVFDQAAEFGFQMSTLDIGGGFTTEGFETMAAVISATLDELFPPHVRVIGEPGRYYVSRAFHLACHIVGRRTLKDPVSQICSYRLYLNDGVYGNFSNIVYDHQHPTPKVLRCGDTFLPNHSGLEHRTGEMTTYAIFGQSCDGMDMICQRYDLPDVLNVGDWLYFENMGAYTMCSATRFNGFTNQHKVIYISTEPGAAALLEK